MTQVRKEGKQLLKVLCGSRAYNLHDEDSDYDYHSVFIVPTRDLLALGSNPRESKWVEGEGEDNSGWELGHFLQLATHCNPTILETFVAPVVESSEEGELIRQLFPAVLARKRVYDAFRGYASNQRKKMFEPYGEDKERRMLKASVAYIRSLVHGTMLLAQGSYAPELRGMRRVELKEIKDGKWRKGDVVNLAMDWEQRITEAYEGSSMQLEPDLEAVNEFLLETRKRHWDE